jgi:hypothetical protein
VWDPYRGAWMYPAVRVASIRFRLKSPTRCAMMILLAPNMITGPAWTLEGRAFSAAPSTACAGTQFVA